MRSPSPPPPAVGRVGALVPRVRDERPEGAAAPDQEERRQQGQGREHGQADTERRERAEAGGRVHLRERHDQQGEDDGCRRRQDRRRGAGDRQAHRLVPALAPPQLLPVAGDQEQGVVGPGAEDEDERDARGLPVHGHSQLGQGVPRTAQELLGGDHREDRDHPEDRAAVDGHEQDQDERERGHEEGGVDPAEDADGVGRVARRAGHLGLEARTAQRMRTRAERVHRVRQGGGVVRDGQRRHDERRGAVLRALRRRRRQRVGDRVAVESLCERVDRPHVGRRQPPGPPEDGDRRRLCAGREAALLLERANRLRSARQERRRVVLLRGVEPRAERRRRADQHERGDGHQPPAPAPDGDAAEQCRHRGVLVVDGERACRSPASALSPTRRNASREQRLGEPDRPSGREGGGVREPRAPVPRLDGDPVERDHRRVLAAERHQVRRVVFDDAVR